VNQARQAPIGQPTVRRNKSTGSGTNRVRGAVGQQQRRAAGTAGVGVNAGKNAGGNQRWW